MTPHAGLPACPSKARLLQLRPDGYRTLVAPLLRGEVSRLVPTVDRAKASVLTKIRFVDRDPRVLPEMSTKVAFLSAPVAAAERKPLTVVHKDAIVNGRLFVVKAGVAHELAVQAGQAIGDLVAVEGVSSGDKVILKPAASIHEGSRVSAAQK